MLLAAHSPDFFPDLQFFAKMKRADVFVLTDDVGFDPGASQHRMKVKGPDGPRWLGAPIVNRSRREPLLEKRIDRSTDFSSRWAGRILLTLRLGYHEAPYFNLYRAALGSILNAPWDRLCDLNLAAIEFCREALDIRTPMLRASKFHLEGPLDAVRLCRAAGADRMLCDSGGSAIALEQAKIAAEPWSFQHPRYLQHPRPQRFVEGLSVLDLLFNYGPQSSLMLGRERALALAA